LIDWLIALLPGSSKTAMQYNTDVIQLPE